MIIYHSQKKNTEICSQKLISGIKKGNRVLKNNFRTQRYRIVMKNQDQDPKIAQRRKMITLKIVMLMITTMINIKKMMMKMMMGLLFMMKMMQMMKLIKRMINILKRKAEGDLDRSASRKTL